MVSYDAPLPATKPRVDHLSAASFDCKPMTALRDTERERQRPPATENELQTQNGDVQQVDVASSSISTTSKSESLDCEQATKSRTTKLHGSAGVPKRPLFDQRSASVSTEQKEPRRRLTSITSRPTRRQSLIPLPSKKSTVHDQSAVVKLNASVTEWPVRSSDVSSANASRAKTDTKKAEARLSSASRSVSTSRRSSLMKATASSLAKRCVDNTEVNDSRSHQPVTSSSSTSFSASLTSKITKLVKGGSKPVASKAVVATAPKNNKRLSLDTSARSRPSLMTSSTGGKNVVTSRPRDNENFRKATSRPSELSQSMNLGQGHRVTSSTRGISSGRAQSSTAAPPPPVQTARKPPASLTKSFSTISLRNEVAKNPVVKK